MTTREAVIKAVAVLATAFNRENSPTLTEAYQLGLSGLTADEIAGATKLALMGSKFMPTPSELRAFVRPPRDLAAEAALAWSAVRKAMDQHDVYGNVDFGPVVNAVVHNLGGWLWLCEQSLTDLEWRKKDFLRVYEQFAGKDVALLNGAPHFGQWRHKAFVRVQIPGLPGALPALPEVQTQEAEEVRMHIRELADAKAAS